jgi:hypothetical protein
MRMRDSDDLIFHVPRPWPGFCSGVGIEREDISGFQILDDCLFGFFIIRNSLSPVNHLKIIACNLQYFLLFYGCDI